MIARTRLRLRRDFFSQFANYLVQEMQSSEHLGSSDEASDDEEDGGWLAHSTFELRPPPVTARQHDNGRRPLSSSGFDVRPCGSFVDPRTSLISASFF